jgi:hypothetical protein
MEYSLAPGLVRRRRRRTTEQDAQERASSRKRTRESLRNPYASEVKTLKATIHHWDDLFSREADETRAEDWVRLTLLGAPLAEKHAWAIPDHRAIRVLQHFSPLIEIGAGKGYWGHMLKQTTDKVDILCFDKIISDELWTEVS